MSSLILIGILLMASVLVLDLIVRIVIVCGRRKRRRAVKPMPMREPQDLWQLRVGDANIAPARNDENNNSIVEEEGDTDTESIPSV